MNKQDWEKQWKILDWMMFIFKPLELLIRNSIHRGMIRLLNDKHLTNPNILELGAGTGKESAWLASKLNGSTTLVDNCDFVIEKSKKYFSKKAVNVQFINKDIRKLDIKEEYDLALSVGLIEHFYGSDLKLIFNKHINAVKKSGYVIVFTPRASSLYFTYKKILTMLRLWMWDEKPFSKEDFINLAKPGNSELTGITNVIFGLWSGALFKKL